MAPVCKKTKYDKKKIEELNSCLYRKLNSNRFFTKRIDLEYDIWCMSLSANYKYIINLIDEFEGRLDQDKPQDENETTQIINIYFRQFLDDLFAFIVYLAIDANSNTERLLSPVELYKDDFNNINLVEKLTKLINTNKVKADPVKILALQTLCKMYAELAKNNLNNLTDEIEPNLLKNLINPYDVQLSSLADRLSDYKKSNYTVFLDDCQSLTEGEDDDFLTQLHSHINSTQYLFDRLVNTHEKLGYPEPAMYKNLFSMAGELIKNAKLSCSCYEQFGEAKSKRKIFKVSEFYKLTSETEKYFIESFSVLVNQKKHKDIHPYIKMYLMNENYKLDFIVSKEAHKKLTKDFKAFLLVIKLLQYCNTISYIIDFERKEIREEDFELLLKEYCKYSIYLLRYFTVNLVELLLNIKINEDDSFDFINYVKTEIQLEIVNYLNNACALNDNKNVSDNLTTAKHVYNFAKSLTKEENERPLDMSEVKDAKNVLTNSIRRVIKLMTCLNSDFFQGIKTIKLEVAKLLRSKVDKTSSSSQHETYAMRHYLDVMICMMEELNKLKTIENPQLKSSNGSIIAQEFCEFLFKSANVLINACVEVSKLFNIVKER